MKSRQDLLGYCSRRHEFPQLQHHMHRRFHFRNNSQAPEQSLFLHTKYMFCINACMNDLMWLCKCLATWLSNEQPHYIKMAIYYQEWPTFARNLLASAVSSASGTDSLKEAIYIYMCVYVCSRNQRTSTLVHAQLNVAVITKPMCVTTLYHCYERSWKKKAALPHSFLIVSYVYQLS